MVSDCDGRRVFTLDTVTAQVGVLAGTGQSGSSDGHGSAATFMRPMGIAIHPTQNYALLADYDAAKIRRIDISTKQVSTLAGGGNMLIGFGTQVKVSSSYLV